MTKYRKKPKNQQELNELIAAKIAFRIYRYTLKHGPCTLKPGIVMANRFWDGGMTSIKGSYFPMNYQHGGILKDYWMEKLGGDVDYFAPKGNLTKS